MSSVDIGELHLLLIIFTDVVSPGPSSVDEVLLSKSHGTREEISFYWYVDRFFVFMPIHDKKDRIVKNCRNSSLFTLRVDTGTLQSEASLSFDAEGA